MTHNLFRIRSPLVTNVGTTNFSEAVSFVKRSR